MLIAFVGDDEDGRAAAEALDDAQPVLDAAGALALAGVEAAHRSE